MELGGAEDLCEFGGFRHGDGVGEPIKIISDLYTMGVIICKS